MFIAQLVLCCCYCNCCCFTVIRCRKFRIKTNKPMWSPLSLPHSMNSSLSLRRAFILNIRQCHFSLLSNLIYWLHSMALLFHFFFRAEISPICNGNMKLTWTEKGPHWMNQWNYEHWRWMLFAHDWHWLFSLLIKITLFTWRFLYGGFRLLSIDSFGQQLLEINRWMILKRRTRNEKEIKRNDDFYYSEWNPVMAQTR